ncbi:MAG: hypothetical protein PHV06_04030 [bacterium]|nr:hypothetical protein [bacterium]
MKYLPYAIILAVIILVTGIFIKIIRKRLQINLNNQREINQGEITAYFSNALILNCVAGIAGEQASQVRARLTLQITGKDNKDYTAETLWLVDITALDYLKPGNSISVKINYDDPNLIYPSAPWAKYLRIEK